MAKIFITGSSEGLGLMAGQLLAEQGHSVVLHARNEKRGKDTRASMPNAHGIVVGDVSTLAGMRDIASQANAIGRFDAVIHNVALGDTEPRRIETEDRLSSVWAVNVLAPYVLTALMARPDRLVFLSSDMHLSGDPSLNDLQWAKRRWNGSQAYSDSKLHDVLLAFFMARLWPDVPSNAVNPGWVPTRMGGPGATDDLDQAHRTQAWLAVGEDQGATGTGRYLFHKKSSRLHPAAPDQALQDRLIDSCRVVSGIAIAS